MEWRLLNQPGRNATSQRLTSKLRSRPCSLIKPFGFSPEVRQPKVHTTGDFVEQSPLVKHVESFTGILPDEKFSHSASFRQLNYSWPELWSRLTRFVGPSPARYHRIWLKNRVWASFEAHYEAKSISSLCWVTNRIHLNTISHIVLETVTSSRTQKRSAL